MPNRRPNFLILFCDQLRADSLGCYGHPFIQTPAIDSLAQKGTLYHRAYTPSPVCVSARCSMITGLYPQKTGCYDNGNPYSEVDTFMERLTRAGYRTHGIGKMHFEPELYALRGFQTREVGEEFGDRKKDDYMRYLQDNGYGHLTRPHGQRDTMYYTPQLAQMPAELHPTAWVAERTNAFLKEQSDEQPFLLWSSFIHPHPPFNPPEPWQLLYPSAMMPDPYCPPGGQTLMTKHQEQQNRYKCGDGGKDRRKDQLIRSYYGACISFIDFQIQRILDTLDAHGLRDNTQIIFSADHGDLLGDYGCYGKRSFLSASAQIPFIGSGVGFDEGKESNKPITLCDIFPTLMNAAGIDCPAVDGKPLQALENRDTIFGQFSNHELGVYHVYHNGWRYIYSAADAKEYLLSPEWDPQESTNLAYNHHTRNIMKKLRALAVEHFDDLNDLDLETICSNGPTQLGGIDPTSDRFHSLQKDPDSNLHILGDVSSADPAVRKYFDAIEVDNCGPGLWSDATTH